MEFIIENWYIFVAGLAVLAVAGFFIYRFFKLPYTEQIKNLKEWLLLVVTEAEKELGSGTGVLKLRQVYDLFLVRFPWLAEHLPFARFSKIVDEVLPIMREMLKNNKAVKSIVEGTVNENGNQN